MSEFEHLRDFPVTVESKLITHKADSQTSFEAADKMIESGALSRQEQRVWEAIKCYKCHIWHNNFTADELSDVSFIDYHLIQRRLGGLRLKGKIERTGQKRDGCCVWRIKGS